ncbi:unnamed protein product [Rhizophagus irregularis]|nr:unnamed protein product [Rhizophagus irregularis]
MSPRMNEMNDIRFIDTSQVPRTYIQSLEQCVYRLQDSSSKLQNTLFNLKSNSRDFSRIKKLLDCQRAYELVTEPEIRDTQSSLAVQIEPRINVLLSKAEEMLQELIIRENELQEEEEELKLQKQKVMAERKPSAIKSPKKSPSKKNTGIILEKMEEQIKDLDNLIYVKTIFLNDKQRALNETQHEFDNISGEGIKKKKYQNQPEFFKRALKQIETKFYAQDDDINEFEALCGFYLKSLNIDHFKILQDISKYQGLRVNCVVNMKKLCKFLFPIDNLGSTVARIVEILLDSDNQEIYINKLGLEFPPEQNHLHRLQTAITLLNKFGVTEIVCEEELRDGQNENKMILRLMVDN